jgi:hypothetical protein
VARRCCAADHSEKFSAASPHSFVFLCADHIAPNAGRYQDRRSPKPKESRALSLSCNLTALAKSHGHQGHKHGKHAHRHHNKHSHHAHHHPKHHRWHHHKHHHPKHAHHKHCHHKWGNRCGCHGKWGHHCKKWYPEYETTEYSEPSYTYTQPSYTYARPRYIYTPPSYTETKPAPSCTCLTKEYAPDGTVIFKDVCTKEMAVSEPSSEKAEN